MKKLRKFIDYFVLFIVLYLIWQIMRILVLPNLEIFPHLEPLEIWLPLYGLVLTICHYITIAVIVLLLCLYVAWLVVRKLFGFNLRKIPPWKQLSQAGLLQLIHAVFGIVFSRMSLKDRFVNVAKRIGMFLVSSYYYTVNTIMGKAKKSGLNIPDPAKLMESKEETPQEKEDDKISAMSTFSKDERRDIQERYLQCVEEQSQDVYPEMTNIQKAEVIAKNDRVATECKLQSFQGYANILSYR